MTTLRQIAAALVAIAFATMAPAQVPAPAWTTIVDTATAQSIQLHSGEKMDVEIGGSVRSLVVVDPTPVAAEVVQGVGIRLTGLALGESLVILMTDRGRVTYHVEVVGRPSRQIIVRSIDEIALAHDPISGSTTISYSPALTGTHASFRQRFDYKQQLGPQRTFRVSGELLRYFNQVATVTSEVASPIFGFNRLAVGITSAIGTLDMLDSTLQVSPLSVAGYTMRGLHAVAAPGTRFDGLDVFAGVARPDFGSIGEGEGWIFGAIGPVLRTEDLRLRFGAIAISPSIRNPEDLRFGGTIVQMDALFTPSKDTRFYGELEYSNHGISGAAQLNLHRATFDATASFSRLDDDSPLISIGAQGAGQTLVSGAFFWHPEGPFRAFANYTRTVQTAVLSSRPAPGVPLDAEVETTPLANETLSITAFVDLPSRSQLSARMINQRLDVLGNSGMTPFRLNARTFGVAYSARFAERWTNRLDVAFTSSREAGGAESKRGLDIREDLRRSWKTGSATAYFRYLNDSESLVGVIIRNPSILPTELRAEYELDPARFFAANGDLLRGLFPGVALPYRSRTEVGFRFQNTFSRFSLSGETSYRRSGSALGDEGGLSQSIGAQFRLDAANDFQVSASHTFAGGTSPSVSSLTVSFTHRFGSSAGEGFQIGDLFGMNRGHVRGRVYMDVNVNGQDDAGEPGLANVDVAIDGGRTVKTGRDGSFEFAVKDRRLHTIALVPDALGETLRATNESEQEFSVAARGTAEVAFGVTNYGSIGGRVYNDLALSGPSGAPLNNPGVTGVRLVLRREANEKPVDERSTDSSGGYVFSDLPPGAYTVEYDVATLPLDFRVGEHSKWATTVAPLKVVYVDIPVAAERAIAGTVFRDRNGNGKFDEGVDEPVSGARITAGAYEAISGANGRYLLRHLPALSMSLSVLVASTKESAVATIILGAAPMFRRGLDFSVVATP